MHFDLILRGGSVITSDAQTRGDVAIAGGIIRAIVAPGAAVDAGEELDVSGKLLFPGFVDAHVHVPGHILDTKLDNYTTATRAAAAGGVTTVLLMPTDDPCSVTPIYFDKKRLAGEGRSLVDFALQAMVGPRSEDEHVDELSALGAVSFEIFLAYGGMPGFIIGDSDYQLQRVMDMIGAVGGIAGVTPHSPSLMTELTRLKRGPERIAKPNVEQRAETRPVLSESLGIARACTAAAETRTEVHLRALSSRNSLDIVRRFKDGGTVTAEVMSHHLVFCERQARRMGAYGVIVPPIRSADDRDALRDGVRGELIDMVVSDHSPALPEDKERGQDDIWLAPPGMPGLQTLFSSMMVLVDRGVLRLPDIARLCSDQPARRFRLGAKGRIAEGANADIVVVDPKAPLRVRNEDQHSRANYTTLANFSVSASIERVFLRGETIYAGGRFPSPPTGKFVRPD
ncbi:dihydroorotase [Sphingomonas bacterium]|uniref:dihydroorotase n=1 Tax=Sphingomonas bacterium TaxID=1895847 RepID=UPI0015760A64|nr:dihydroorotase family protein [Sphingomonas bacterium]